MRTTLGFLQVTLLVGLQWVPMAGKVPMGTDAFYPPPQISTWNLSGTHRDTAQVRAALLPSSPAAPVWSIHWDSPGDCRRRVLGAH